MALCLPANISLALSFLLLISCQSTNASDLNSGASKHKTARTILISSDCPSETPHAQLKLESWQKAAHKENARPGDSYGAHLSWSGKLPARMEATTFLISNGQELTVAPSKQSSTLPAGEHPILQEHKAIHNSGIHLVGRFPESINWWTSYQPEVVVISKGPDEGLVEKVLELELDAIASFARQSSTSRIRTIGLLKEAAVLIKQNIIALESCRDDLSSKQSFASARWEQAMSKHKEGLEAIKKNIDLINKGESPNWLSSSEIWKQPYQLNLPPLSIGGGRPYLRLRSHGGSECFIDYDWWY